MVQENVGWPWPFLKCGLQGQVSLSTTLSLSCCTQTEKPLLRLQRHSKYLTAFSNTCPHPGAWHPRCTALSRPWSHYFTRSFSSILLPCLRDPSTLRALGHFHLHPPTLGWAPHPLNALRPGVGNEPCGPY